MLHLLLAGLCAHSQPIDPPCVAQSQGVVAFVDVTVIPMDRERRIPGQTVVVRGDRIVELGPVASVTVPEGATRVEGKGRFLIPGLAEMHAHIPGGQASDSAVERTLFMYVAGGLTTYGPLGKLTAADFDREIAINLKTTVLVSQAAVEALSRTRGCIVNFASIAYFEPQKPMAVYSAAKYGVAGFTRSLALELAEQHIRVNAVAPAAVRTSDNVAAMGEGAVYVELDDITDGVLLLAAPESAAITGHILPIAPAASGKA